MKRMNFRPSSARAVAAASLVFVTLGVAGLAGCESCSPKPQVYGGDGAPVATVVADAEPINMTPIPTASVAAALNPDHLPAYAGPTGSVEGTIYVKGAAAPERPADFSKCADASKTFGKAFREGEVKSPSEQRWLADAVVVVTGYSGYFIPEKDESEELTIEGCAFSRRTVTLTYGQRLDVKNLSKEFWTPVLQQPGGVSTVWMMATPGGDPVKLYPKVPGHYHLVDHDRKYAVIDVYAFLHPLHTASKIGGTYRIDNIPVGKLKVNTTHPELKNAAASAEVVIEANKTAKVDLVLENKAPGATDAGTNPDAPYYPPLH